MSAAAASGTGPTPSPKGGRDTGPIAVLIGLPGSGKSTVGAALAELLTVDVLDTDAAITERTGESIVDLFARAGEAAFRALERQEVTQALRHHRGILNLGGGALTDPLIQHHLADTCVIHLEVAAHEAARRLAGDRSRPLLDGDLERSWGALADARLPLYRHLATHRVDTTGRTPHQIARHLTTLLKTA